MRLRAASIGTYAWLRFGFFPDQHDWKNYLKAQITERLYEFRNQIPKQVVLEVQRILQRASPRSAWPIADDTTPGRTDEGDEVMLGQALLANSGVCWDESLLFGVGLATVRFELYVGK